MPIERSKLRTPSIGEDSNLGFTSEGTKTTAHARARRRITQMLSREPPASSDHNIKTHGERNTPIFRYNDPRNPPLEQHRHREKRTSHVRRRRCWMQVYTTVKRSAKPSLMSANDAALFRTA